MPAASRALAISFGEGLEAGFLRPLLGWLGIRSFSSGRLLLADFHWFHRNLEIASELFLEVSFLLMQVD